MGKTAKRFKFQPLEVLFLFVLGAGLAFVGFP